MGEGMQLTYRQLMSVLEKHGVKQIDPVGQPFNPDFHQAMTMAPSTDVPANHVLSVMQKGYRQHDRLLRPGMVVVARAPAETERRQTRQSGTKHIETRRKDKHTATGQNKL